MPAPFRVLALCLLASALAPAALRAGAETFSLSPSLAPRVDFWTRVYSEVGTNGGLIHDSEDLSRVYEVVRAAEGASDRAVEQAAGAAKDRVRAALRALAAGKRQGLSKTERRVLAEFPPSVSSRTLAAAVDRVRFQRGQANKFRAGLQRMGRWEGYIRRALRERGVPEDLVALPHVESSFDPSAHSHAGASGLWQFTRPTGRLYMRVDYIVDERRDPFVASESAARLLRSNYERLGTWPLAITAYNHGPGGMAKAVRTLGTRDLGTIVARYQSPSFGFASRNFYTEFLAARRIDQDPERYFGPIRKDGPADHESVVLRKSYGASVLANALGLSTAELRDWNPALLSPVWRGSRHVPASYELRVPRRSDRPPASQLVAGIQGEGYQGVPIPRRTAAASEAGGAHRVRPGETLGAIARRYGTSVDELASLNAIRDPRRLRPGQVLQLPGAEPAAEPPTAAPSAPPTPAAELAGAEPAPAAGPVTQHTVAPGETLIQIGERYGVSLAKIAARNGIRDPRELRAGQVLEIPLAAPSPPAPAPAPTVQVARADPSPPAGPPPAPSASPAESPPTPAAGKAGADPGAAPPEDASGAAAGSAPAAEPEAPAAAEPDAPAAAPDTAPAPAPAPAPPAAPATRRYTIAPGDTLASIADRFGVGVDALAEANGRPDPRRLRPGQVLEVPGGEGAPAAAASAETRAPAAEPEPAPAPAPRSYTIASGDTLGAIGRRFGVDPQRLAAANGIRDPRRLHPGQALEIPGASAPADAAPAAPRIYTVRSGDTLFSIAQRHGVTVTELAELNGLHDRHHLSIGQRLRLPEGS
jgi:peptidoglycan lytic transglycosylase D